jgi:hypothetical protein
VSNHNEANTICLLGEIVSIYEKDGIQYAKIHYDPGYVDLIFQEVQDVFLNDRVVVHSSLEVESISTNIENDHSHLK